MTAEPVDLGEHPEIPLPDIAADVRREERARAEAVLAETEERIRMYACLDPCPDMQAGARCPFEDAADIVRQARGGAR